MSRVTVHRRVRPIRLCFLVDPKDEAGVRQVIQLNTILWGGRYNSILPVSAVPNLATPVVPTLAEFVRGNIAAFDPDYIVTVGEIDTSPFGLNPRRLRTFESLHETHGGL